MATQRRMGVEGAKNRDLLVDAAALILVEEGYAAITARRVAEKAGLKVQLVYYYFQSMDDVILAVVRRNSARRQAQIEEAMDSPEPLRALWDMTSDPAIAITASELVALANHRETIRAEIVLAARQMRTFQIELVSRVLASRGIDENRYPAGAVVTIGAALARALAQDSALGVVEGYEEAIEMLERMLGLFRPA